MLHSHLIGPLALRPGAPLEPVVETTGSASTASLPREAGVRPVYPKPRRLPDGSTVLLRPVERSDAPSLGAGFARLSPESRRSRFLGAKIRLSQAELRYLTDIDHVDHEAIVAVAADDGRGAGIARYIRDHVDRHRAEVAVTIADEWQRRGVGLALLAELGARALSNGIRQFTALVAADNIGAVRLLRRMAADVELVSSGWGTMTYDIFLRPSPTCRSHLDGARCSITS